MSNDNDENIITDFNDGKNFRRKEDYNNKKPILVCFNGRAFRLKGSIEGILDELMKVWKGQDFDEEILKIRTPTGILFSKSSDEIFNHKLIEGIYVEKARYESASANYIIELCLAILEQFRYNKELKILFADEKHPYNVDIKSLEPIYWGESGKEYVWDFYDPKGVVHSYLKMPDIYGLYDKIPVASLDDEYLKMIVIDYKDGEILEKHMQQQRQGELRINKPFFKKHGIGKVGKQFRVRCGFLYSKIRNHVVILDCQEKLSGSEKVEVTSVKVNDEIVDINKVLKQEEIDKEEGIKMDKKEEAVSEDIKELQRLREIVGPEEFVNIVNNVREAAKQNVDNDERNAEISRIAEEQRIKDDEESARLLAEERDRRYKIDGRLEKISEDSKLVIRATNVLYEGPPRTEKTTKAKKCGVELISTFIDAETKDKFKEFYNKGYIEVVTFNPASDSNKTIEGTTIYTEKEGVPTDRLRYISLAGLIKDKSKLAIGIAIRLNEEYLKKKDTSYNDVFGKYEEEINTTKMNKKEEQDLFKYAPKVVLILDELNRGNVPELLGDVVTAMERNKRLGEDDETPVKFIRSGDKFVMPPNLYIIATRNNAVNVDVSHIDEGIMARFVPEEVWPNFGNVQKYLNDNEKEKKDAGVYNVISISIDAITILNNRISDNVSLGRGKQIGHTYLYDIKDSLDAMIEWKRILKLIKDYCCEDYDEVNNILFKGKDKKWVDCRNGIHGINSLNDLEEFIKDIIGSEKGSKKAN